MRLPLRAMAVALAISFFGLNGTARAAGDGPAWSYGGQPVADHGDFYVGFGVGAMWTDLPTYKAGVGRSINGAPFVIPFNIDDSLVTVGGTGVLGVTFPGTAEQWGLGERLRLELAIGGGLGNTSKTINTSAATALAGFAMLDGKVNVAIAGGPVTVTDYLKTDTAAVNGALRLKVDVRVSSSVVVTPAIGFLMGYDRLDYDYQFYFPGPEAADYQALERVKSFRVGGLIGADVIWMATKDLSFMIGAEVQLQNVNVDYRGRDCFAFTLATPGPACGKPHLAETQANTSNTFFGVNWLMRLGVQYDFGWARVALTGVANWTNAVPTISHPEFLNPAVNSVSLGKTSTWSYGGFARIVIPLN